MSRVCLDAEHGGVDQGAVYDGVREAVLNIEVCLRAEQYLQRMGHEVLLVRRGDTSLTQPGNDKAELIARSNLSDSWGADVCVTVAHNACGNPDVSGREVYHNEGRPESYVLARCIDSHLYVATGPGRGIRQGSIYHMVRVPKAVTALVEVAYLSNATERNRAKSEWYQEKAALGLAYGIDEYLRMR